MMSPWTAVPQQGATRPIPLQERALGQTMLESSSTISHALLLTFSWGVSYCSPSLQHRSLSLWRCLLHACSIQSELRGCSLYDITRVIIFTLSVCLRSDYCASTLKPLETLVELRFFKPYEVCVMDSAHIFLYAPNPFGVPFPVLSDLFTVPVVEAQGLIDSTCLILAQRPPRKEPLDRHEKLTWKMEPAF